MNEWMNEKNFSCKSSQKTNEIKRDYEIYNAFYVLQCADDGRMWMVWVGRFFLWLPPVECFSSHSLFHANFLFFFFSLTFMNCFVEMKTGIKRKKCFIQEEWKKSLKFIAWIGVNVEYFNYICIVTCMFECFVIPTWHSTLTYFYGCAAVSKYLWNQKQIFFILCSMQERT